MLYAQPVHDGKKGTFTITQESLKLHWMERAFEAARSAGERGEVPVGALVIDANGQILAVAGNEVEARHDPSAHAEMLAMRHAAAARHSRSLKGCALFVTLEPCAMCAAAIVHFRVSRVIFGAYDAKGGGVDHGVRVFDQPGCLHRPEVTGGVREREAGALLKEFFLHKRES